MHIFCGHVLGPPVEYPPPKKGKSVLGDLVYTSEGLVLIVGCPSQTDHRLDIWTKIDLICVFIARLQIGFSVPANASSDH